jgi:hypothetical protein
VAGGTAERPEKVAVAAKLEELALAGDVGLTPHAAVVYRAHAGVTTVSEAFRKQPTMAICGRSRSL